MAGDFDPAAIRPFLTASNAVRGFEIVQFTEPVRLDVDVWGRLYDYDSIGATGRVALTNFTVRSQSVDNVTGDFFYTNRVVEFSNSRLWRGAQTMTADLITLDLNRQMISFKNGYSTADPVAVTRAIGPKTAPHHGTLPFSPAADGAGGRLRAVA